MTRSEWESRHAWNEPYPPWVLATWRERLVLLGVWIGLAIVACFMLIAVLTVVGGAMETIGQHREDHDRCMKQATNGYEIERCK